MGFGKLVSTFDPDMCGSASVSFFGEICDEKRNGFVLHLMVVVFGRRFKVLMRRLVFHGSSGQLVFS